jgi:anion-transporting  ArsA/GET3 family ATPase
MPVPLIDLRLLVLSGKGGVGRTTVAAAIARAAAATGRRVLIAQTDAVERLGKMLGRPGPIGSTVTNVATGIDAVNMTPKESLHQYALLVLKYEAVYRALFANRAVGGFLSAIPGLDAYAMLGKAWWHTTEPRQGDIEEPARGVAAGGQKRSPPTNGPPRPKYDLVILDGPASGHAIAMLKIPGAIIDATPAGPLVKDARALFDLLNDPDRTALVVVTRPEELPASETRELVSAARRDLRMALGPVIVNAVPSDRLSHGPVTALLDRFKGRPSGDPRLDPTLETAAGVRAQRETADRVINGLTSDPGLPLVLLPWLPSTDLGPREIDQLAARLMNQR